MLFLNINIIHSIINMYILYFLNGDNNAFIKLNKR